MQDYLCQYTPIAQAITSLFYPHAEVVIHDLKTGRIAALFNSFSKRNIGDESLLEELNETAQLPDVFPVYVKTNFDGRQIKSVSVTIRDEKGEPSALLCINLDVSRWEELHHVLSAFLNVSAENRPQILFKDDWREKINVFVSEYLKKSRQQ